MNFAQLSFGFFALKIYGIFIAVAFCISAWKYYKKLQQKKMSVDFFLHHFWRWLVGGLIMGRIFSLLLNPAVWQRNGFFSLFAFWDGEIHFFGTILGFLLIMWWDLHKKKMNFLEWVDAGIIPFLFGFLIVDIAGFLTGAVYGTATTLPWGVQYETFGVDILKPVHPVTLYAFFLHLWLWYWISKREKTWERFSGKLALQAGFWFLLTHIFLQFFRGDPTVLIFPFFRIEQIFYLMALIFLIVWDRFHKRYLF